LLPEPHSSTEPDNTRYLNKPALMKGCAEQVAKIQGQPCDVIFIGDSITAGWLSKGKEVWAKYYSDRHALDFGIGGDKTQNVLWRLENMDVKGLTPKVAVVLIGTNNLANTTREIADGVKAVVAKALATFSGVKIILVSIMPNRRVNVKPKDAEAYNQKMMDADAIIRNYADDRTVFYLDLVPLMAPVGNNWKGLGTDHLHPDATGYEIWAAAMDPLLTRLLANH
jgi:lysophospholipase L1-like esterase